MSQGFRPTVFLLLILFELVASGVLLEDKRRNQESEKQDLLKELEELMKKHQEKTKTHGASVSLDKLRILRDMMEELTILMEDIYAEAAASVTETTAVPTSVEPTTPPMDRVYTNCNEAFQAGHRKSRVYNLTLSTKNQHAPRPVYCEMNVEGGGWTVFQKRFNGSVDFYRNWVDYKTGFGDPNREYWLGLDALHQLTKGGDMELYIMLEEFSGALSYAKYSEFSVGSEADRYRINVGYYSGTAGDGLRYHNKMAFSTRDRDNDESEDHCAVERGGAWWYVRCMMSNLNGLYRPSADAKHQYGFSWYKLKNSYRYFLKASKMMVRPSSRGD